MPSGVSGPVSHKIHDHAAPATKALSDDQFDQLTAMLDDQHRILVDLLQPIHEVAQRMLADRAAGDGSKVPAADPEQASGERSASEQSSG